MKSFAIMLVALLAPSQRPVSEVRVAPQVRNTLEFLYKHLPVEFSLCAYGEVRREVVWIERVDLPFIHFAEEDGVLADINSCSFEKTLGLIHSHLSKFKCKFSRADVRDYFHSEYIVSYPFDFLYCRGNILWQEIDHPPPG